MQIQTELKANKERAL